MHCGDEINRNNITNLLVGLRRVYFSSLMERAMHFQCKLKSYSLIFPAAKPCPSELINEICHHAKPLCLTTFPKSPQLPAPWCSPTSSHTHTQTKCPHTCSHTHTYAVERWDFHAGRQANSQTNTHMYTTCPTKRFFFLHSLQAQQTNKHR